MTIRLEHPFRDPESDPVRRLRGRIGGGVTLWTSGAGGERAGLTVTSLMVAAGEQAHLLALLDPDSDLVQALCESDTAVVQLLTWRQRGLADVFAGLSPAPGGMFAQAAFEDTEWGPRLAGAATWAGVRLVEDQPVGWSSLVTCVVEQVQVGEEDDVLLHHRGRYLRPLDSQGSGRRSPQQSL